MNHTGVASTGSRRHARKNLSFTGYISVGQGFSLAEERRIVAWFEVSRAIWYYKKGLGLRAEG